MTIHVPRGVVRALGFVFGLVVLASIVRMWGDIVRYAKIESM